MGEFIPPTDGKVTKKANINAFVPPTDSVELKKKETLEPTATPQKSASVMSTGSSGGVNPAFKSSIPSPIPDFNSMESVKSVVQKPKIKLQKPPVKEDTSFFDYLKENLDTGLATVSKSVYDAPGLVYDVAASITNPMFRAMGVGEDKLASSDKLANDLGFKNIPSEILKEKIKVSNEKINAYSAKNGGDALQAVKDGNYVGAAKLVAGTTAQSLPIMIAAMASGGESMALTAIGVSTASTKNAQLKEENPEMALGTRVLNSANAGIIEAVTGHLFTGASGAVMKKIIADKGVEAGSKIIGKSFRTTIEKSIEKNPLVSAVGEVVEESAVEFGNQVNDMSSGIRTEFDFHAIKNAGLSATGMGGLQTLGVYGAKGYVKAKDYAKLKSINKEVFKLRSEIDNGNLSPENKAILSLRADRLEAENKKLLGTEIEKAKALPTEAKTELNALNNEFEDLKTKFDDIDDAEDIPANLKPAMKEEIKLQASKNQKRKTEILSQNDGLEVNDDFSKFEGVEPDFDLENGKISSLPLKEQNRLNKLAVEKITNGDKTIEYTKEQVSETANEIYKNEQTPPTPEAQPQTEVPQQAEAEKVDELRDSTKISQNQAISPVEDVVAPSVKKPILNKKIDVEDSSNRKGLIPISELEDFIGEDRNGNAAMPNSRETIDKLKEDIAKNGFKEPIVLVYDKFSNDGEASIIEGNHRIIAAKELGFTEIPVRIEKGTLRSDESRKSDGMFPLNRKKIGNINDTRGVKGSDLGLTVRQPNENDYVNEATPETNTPTNGNVPLGASNVGESGNAKPKSNSKSSVQSSVDGGEVKGDAEGTKKSVTLPNLDDITDFINQTYLNDGKQEDKPTAETNQETDENSAKENSDLSSGTKRSKQKEIKLNSDGLISQKGRTPLEKRKFKGDRKTAVNIEVVDNQSLVLNYFARGGKISSDYFSSKGELQARNNSFNGIASKKAEGIDSIAHNLWQSQENKTLKLDTQQIKNSIEDVVNSHNTVQDVVNTLITRYSKEEKQQTPEEEQAYFLAAMEFQKEEKKSDEETQEAISVLDQLSDSEIIELAESQDKSFEDFLKDLEKRQVTYDFGPFSEQGTIQLDGWILSQNGELLSPESVSNVKQVNLETQVEVKVEKPISKDTPELKEVNAKLEKANENLRIAKEALDRKAKLLDKELLKDNEDIFGERKSQNENKLFDERVDVNARNKATKKERQSVKDAQDEIKNLTDLKAKIESGEISSTKEIYFAKIDEIANIIKKATKADIDPNDYDKNGFGFDQDKLIDLIATAAKSLVSKGIDINQAIKQVVDSIKAKFGDFDVDIDSVKERINPKKEADNNFKSKSGKKSLLGRLIEGGNPDEITKAVKELGENYDVRNQEDANTEAMDFIDKVGASEALKAIKDGLITNSDVKMLIYDEALTRLKTEISDEINNNPEDREALIQKFQELSNDFDNAIRDAGQGIAIMNYIYNKNQTLKYNLAKQINDWKRNDPNGEIPADVKAKFEELEKKLKDVEERIKDAEERAKKAEDELAIKNIQEDVERKNQAARKNKSGLTPQEQTRKKQLRDKFTRANDVTGIPALLVDPEFREYLGLVLKTAKGDFANFSNEILKDLGKTARQHLPELFANAGGKGDVKVTDLESIAIGKNGKIKIPAQLLRDYVEAGETDIDVIAQLIKDDIADEFPDVDVRDIRDALTGYGKQVNPNKDEISAQVNKLKEYGRLLSAYDDVMNGKMPLKSGLVRPKMEQKARELRKNINRLAKELNLEPVDLEKQWANALDKVKSQLKNQIEDLDKQISNGEKRKVERTSIKLDEEATALKEIRDAKKQLLDDLVGKPELTEEQKIANAEKSLENSIKKIQEEIDTNDIAFKEKPTAVTSQKIEELKSVKKALLESKKQLRQEAGLIEQQRLKTAKTRIKNQIEELNTRIKNKDFAKKEIKPILADNELNTLRAEKEAVYEEYEKMKYLQELENRTLAKKIMDEGLEAIGLARAVKASLDLGLIGIQLRGFTYSELWRSPKELGRKFVKMFGAIGSQNKTNKAMSALIGHPLYSLAKKLDIGITHPDLRNEIREEIASGNLLHFIWSSPVIVAEALGAKNIVNQKRTSIGDSFINSAKGQFNKLFKNYQLDIKQKEKFSIKEQWRNINAFEAVERGLSVYGNQLRFEEFVRGVDRLKAEGKDEINHLEDYKLLASYIRTFSGRAKPAGFELNQKALNVFFFSFKNMASVIQQLNPVYYMLQHGRSTDFKNGNYFKPTVANKMAMATMFKSVVSTSATLLFVMATYNAFKDDDEEEATIEKDPRSSDFGKLKIGNFRYDPWGGYIPLISLYARLYFEETKKADGSIVKFGEDKFGIQNRGDVASRFLINKESPGFQMFHKYMTSTEEVDKATGETYRATPFGGKLSEEDAYSFYPIFLGSVKQAKEKDYDGVKAFLTAYSILGLGNVQDYEQSESKSSKKGAFDIPKLKQPDFKLPKF